MPDSSNAALSVSTLLCFDFGTKRIGVAVGQALTKTATPLQAVPNHQLVLRLPGLIAEWQPSVIVVGVPLNMDGTEQAMTRKAREFIHRLRAETGLRVYEMDERLTSVEARSRVYAEVGYKGLKKADIDSIAAKLILESWLQQNL